MMLGIEVPIARLWPPIASAQANRVRRRPMAPKLKNQLELPGSFPKTRPSFAAERAMAELYGLPVAGVDEAGRGPWAGPVVAAAAILDISRRAPNGLNDSKQLTEGAREELYETVMRRAIAWGVGIATVEEIDSINIRQATHLAMRRALASLTERSGITPSSALVDGDDAPLLEIPTRAMISGDARAYAISAASIIAKVTRDRMMSELDVQHPGYGFARHKGYGTLAHAEALTRLGPCGCHRASFSPISLALEARRGDAPVMPDLLSAGLPFDAPEMVAEAGEVAAGGS